MSNSLTPWYFRLLPKAVVCALMSKKGWRSNQGYRQMNADFQPVNSVLSAPVKTMTPIVVEANTVEFTVRNGDISGGVKWAAI